MQKSMRAHVKSDPIMCRIGKSAKKGNRSMAQWAHWSSDGSAGQQVNGSTGQWVSRSMGQQINGSSDASTCQRVNGSSDGSTGQWVHRSTGVPSPLFRFPSPSSP